MSHTLALLISLLLFSTGGWFIKIIPEDLHPLPLAGLRSVLAALLVLVYWMRTRPLHTLAQHRPIGWVAIGAYMTMIICFVSATRMTTAANAILLQYTLPIWVLIGGYFWLAERATRNQLITILLCLVGMVLFFYEQLEPEEWTGNMLAILSGIALAAFVICVRLDRNHDPLRAVFWANLFVGFITVPYGLITQPETLASLLAPQPILALLWLGIFQLGLAYIFYVYSVTGLPALEVATLSLIEPVLNPIWVFLFVGETPSFWSCIGGGMILLSVLLHGVLSSMQPVTADS